MKRILVMEGNTRAHQAAAADNGVRTASGIYRDVIRKYFDVFDAPCIHDDEIESLPCGSTLLCSNAHSDVQGALIPVERSLVWGVQYHPEFDLNHLAGIIRLYGEAVLAI